MDLGVEVDPDWDDAAGAEPSASHHGAEKLGLAGTVSRDTATKAAGLSRLEDGDFGSGPTTPMVPSTWR